MKEKNLFRGTAIPNHLLLQLINILGQLVLVPVFLRNYPIDLYVFWILMGAISSFMLLADSAILQAFSVPLSKHYINNHLLSKTLIRQVVRTLIVLELTSCVILVSAFGILRIHHNNTNQISLMMALSIFSSLLLANMITVVIHLFLTLFQVIGEYNKGINFITKGKFVEVCLLVAFVSLGLELLILAICIVTVRLLTAYQMARNLKIPKDEINLSAPHAHLLTRNLTGAVALSATMILAGQGMLIVISQWANAKEILLFTVSKMLTVPVRITADSLALGTFPLLVKKVQLQENTKNYYKKLAQLYALLVVTLAPIIMILGFLFFGHLTNNKVDFNISFLLLTIASTALDGLVTILFQQFIIHSKSFQPGIMYLLFTILQLILIGYVLNLHNIVYAIILNIIGDVVMLILIKNTKVEK